MPEEYARLYYVVKLTEGGGAVESVVAAELLHLPGELAGVGR
jgi:hypothetical protein